MDIGIIDYGVGNIKSVNNAFSKKHKKTFLLSSPNNIKFSDVLVLPGVGSFSSCKKILDQNGWSDSIREHVIIKKKPILGICLGMHLLADTGTEGVKENSNIPGLGLIPGKVLNLKLLGCKNRLPQIGWNEIILKKKSYLFDGIKNKTNFYFVHSYTFVPKDDACIYAETSYDITYASIVGKDNIWGIQFHLEKSSKSGLKIIENFIKKFNA